MTHFAIFAKQKSGLPHLKKKFSANWQGGCSPLGPPMVFLIIMLCCPCLSLHLGLWYGVFTIYYIIFHSINKTF